MSLAKFFGFGKNEKSITPGEAIQKLRDTEEMLCKKQDFLEKKIDQEISLAKQHGSKNKRGDKNLREAQSARHSDVALQALKRKKRYEKQLQQIDGTLSTIEMQREALESASTNTTVLQTMNEAAKALRAAHQDMDVDKVHDMMDDIAEQQEVAHEISEAISNPVAFGDGVDEDELLAELEELEQEALDEKLLETTGVTDELPEVPSAIPETVSKKKAKEDYDDDMAELAAWAS